MPRRRKPTKHDVHLRGGSIKGPPLRAFRRSVALVPRLAPLGVRVSTASSVGIHLGNYQIVRVEVVSPDPFVIAVDGTQQIDVQVTATRYRAPDTTEPADEAVFEEFLLDPIEAGTTYSSDTPSVATVDSAGLITGESTGSAIITVTAGGTTDLIGVTVDNTATVTSIDVAPATFGATVGTPVTVTGTPRNSGGQTVLGQTVTWDSDDDGVATVGADSGTDPHTATITPVAPGTATITGTCNGHTDTCVVTVTAAASGYLFTDNFSTGGKAGSQNGVSWTGVNKHPDCNVAVVSDPGAASGHALGFTFGGNPVITDDAWAEQRVALPDISPAITIEMEVFSPLNYVHRYPGSSNNNKGLRVWDTDPDHVDVTNLFGWSTYANANGTSQMQVEYKKYGSTTGNFSLGPWTTVFLPGTVDIIRIACQTGSAVGTPDGILKMWINGVLRVNATNLLNYDTSATPGSGRYWRNCYVFGWSNSGFDETTTMNLRRFTVWSGIVAP